MGSLWSVQFRRSFSRREVEILRLIKEGLSNQAIAQRLSLSLDTIKWYNQQIFGKLGVSSRVQAVEKAMEVGLIDAWVTPFPVETGQNTTCPLL